MIKLQQIIQELSKTGVMTGTQEKEFNKGLRRIHSKYPDRDREKINKQTIHSEINYGGCGIFAKLLYYNLRKYLNITPEIVVFDFPFSDSNKGEINNYKSLREFNEDGYSCVHIALKIKDNYIDSSGIHKESWFKKVYGFNEPLGIHEGMTIQTLTKWVATSDSWNSTFDRYTTGNINKDMVKILKQVAKIK